MYTDTTNVEPEMYDSTNNNWSHWNSNEKLKEKFGSCTRETSEQSALNKCTVQPFTESDDTRCCVNTIFPPEDGHVNARNMSRIIV